MPHTNTIPVPVVPARSGAGRSLRERLAWLKPANLAFLDAPNLAPYVPQMPRVAAARADLPSAVTQPERLGPPIEWLT
ncbi:hypothetical protein [Microbacterium sp.]|uniref:hypothetical protein n=1 Tax=Microbacterium sp. TaxID=51671 RepID=UPI0039E53775